MKRIISVFILIFSAFLYSRTVFSSYKPVDNIYVNDFAGVLDNDTKNYIISQGKTLEDKTSAQLAAVTVSSLEGALIEDYSLNIFRDWGIGNKTKNNGVLILLSIEDRKARIAVGDGLEGAINDAKAGRIIDNYGAPYFKNNDWNNGILATYKALLSEIYKEYGLDVPQEITESLESIRSSNSEENGYMFTIVIVLIVIILIIILSNKGGKGGSSIGGPFIGMGGGFGSGGFGSGGFGGGGTTSGGGATRGF